MPKGKMKATVKGINLTDQHWATLMQFAKDQGYPSLSSAMRRVIDEWLRYKTAELAQPSPQTK